MSDDQVRSIVREETRAAVADIRAELAALAVPARLVSPGTAARALGISETRVYEHIAAGRIRSFKDGRRRLVPVAALDEFVAALSEGAA